MVAMMPLLLRYLDIEGFIIWSIFTTLGGITLQLERAIQVVSVRDIARPFHAGNMAALEGVLRRVRRAYFTLSLAVAGPVLLCGLLYINFILGDKFNQDGLFDWVIFAGAYALNYYFGFYNAILLGMERVNIFNNVASITRLINLVATYLLLKAGLGVLGICVSFLGSVTVSCISYMQYANRAVNRYRAKYANKGANFNDAGGASGRRIALYTIYMFSSYLLYRGGLLVATALFDKNEVASYGLSLQVFNLLLLASIVPTQVWLGRLVRAISHGSREEVFREFCVTGIVSNGVFMAGVVVLWVFGDTALAIIHSKVILSSNVIMAALTAAFFIELNIYLAANFLVIKENYSFVAWYAGSALVGGVAGALLTFFTRNAVSTLILAPVLIQAVIALPAVTYFLLKELDISIGCAFRRLARVSSSRP